MKTFLGIMSTVHSVTSTVKGNRYYKRFFFSSGKVKLNSKELEKALYK